MKELIIEAKIENMDAVQDFINENIGDCAPKVRKHLMIAVDEIFSNIARYAYNPPAGGAAVRIAADSDIITVEFEDSGVAYDPLSSEDPDISLSAEDREIGGLGMFMVKNIMDSVTYRREGNNNILTIKKKVE